MAKDGVNFGFRIEEEMSSRKVGSRCVGKFEIRNPQFHVLLTPLARTFDA
jgi:hypothetical protein